MNYLTTLIFFILLFIYYLIVATPIVNYFNITRNSFAAKIIFGFLIVFFIGFIVGVPCQFLSVSWMLFAVIYSLLLILILFLSIFFQRNAIYREVTYIFKKPMRVIKNNLKKYWFVYILVIIFTILSIMNMQPYLKNNFTDDHYIVQILHMVKTNKLLNINNDGYLFNESSKRLFEINGYRSINTYELVYSYFATIFHISVVFFCRFTMTFHNYLICFFVMQLIASIFVKEEYSQYALLFIAFLMIPQGYAAKSNLLIHIRMFENWRFQTGMYMGGSITRIFSIPILFYLFYLLSTRGSINGKIVKSVIFSVGILFIITCCVLISFQTTGISYVGLMVPIYLFGIILLLVKKCKTLLRKFIAFLVIVSCFFILMNYSDNIIKLIVKIGPLSKLINLKTLTNNYNGYVPYYLDSFEIDFFAKFAIIPYLIVIILSKSYRKRVIGILSLSIYLLFLLRRAKLFLGLIGYLFFGIARMQTAMLIYSIIFFGIALILVIEVAQKYSDIKFINKTIPVTSALILSLVLATIQTKQPQMLKETLDGDGFVKEGYSFTPIIANDQYLPDLFVKLGNYFDKLPNEYYSIAFETNIDYKGITYSGQSVLLASSKIIRLNMSSTYKSFYTDGFSSYLWYVIGYLEGRVSYKDASYYLKQSKVDYIFTTRKNIKNDLLKNGHKLCYGSDKNGFWLFKNR